MQCHAALRHTPKDACRIAAPDGGDSLRRGDEGPGAMLGWSEPPDGDRMLTLFTMLGYPNLPTEQMLVIAGLAWASAICLAWIADAILGDGVFGVVLNALILITGAVLGVLLWRRLGYLPAVNPAQTMALVATGSGIALLVACATLRRWI